MTPQQFAYKLAFAPVVPGQPQVPNLTPTRIPVPKPPVPPSPPKVPSVGQSAKTLSQATRPAGKTRQGPSSGSGRTSIAPKTAAQKQAYGNAGGWGIPTVEKPKPKLPPGPDPKLKPGGKIRPTLDLSDPKQFGKAAAMAACGRVKDHSRGQRKKPA